ncbi:MAG: 30S ribosomal protein S20 [Thermodesulfovibrionia bacterium]
MPARAVPKKSKSVKKRIRQAKKRTLRNRAAKSMLKTLIKKIESEVASKNIEGAKTALNEIISAIDKAKAKGLVHKNTASRKVSRLTKLVNSLSLPVAA